MRPIHILHIIDGLNIGGAEMLLCNLVRALQGERYRFSVCYSTPGPLETEIAALGVPMTQLSRLAQVDPLLLLKICRVIQRDPPQIVHTHLFKSDFHGRPAARLCGVPVVVSTLHSRPGWAANPVLGRLYGLTAQLADRVIAVSEEVREYSIAHTRIAPDKVCTIVNGVQVERFSSDNPQDGLLRQELGIPPHAPLIGIVGRLIPVKDHEVFLQAAASICQELPEARFLIVGDGPLRSTLAAVSAALGLSEAVVFCGLRNDIPSVMASLDLLVFSSRSEGLPVAMLEGMASARAIVATAVGGMPGVMIDGATGLLVPPADPAALARACLQILRDPAAAARMGHAGRMRVQAHYSIAAMVQQTKQLYETLLNQRGLGLAPQPA